MKDNRMSNLKFGFVLVIMICIIVGCQPEQDDTLPTLVDLNATNEAVAISATETAIAPTATSLRPTLPPTFTPTVELLPSETPLPTLDPNVSPTPEGYNEAGTIYYNYNGDSIARVFPDGTGNEIIMTFGVDQPITDLTASPDGRLLAFVAPAGGSAREVWVTNRDGSYLQQVSCLGYNSVTSPSFAPDSNRIAFFAAPLATTDKALYVADFAGSNDCPTGNNQQLLFPVSTTFTGDIAWNSSQTMIYYNAGGTFIYDFGTRASYVITRTTGFSSDFGATYDYDSNQFAYLQYRRDLTTGIEGGSVIVIDDADTFRAEYEINRQDVYAHDVAFGEDNESVIYVTRDEIVSYEYTTTSRFTIRDELANPLFDLAPNQRDYIYTDIDPETGVVQIYRSNRIDQRELEQVTSNPEGQIISILWLGG